MELDDSKGEKVISVKDVYFHIPFTSLMSGSPLITLKLQEPEIRVVKDKQGKMNAVTLMKSSASTTETKKQEEVPAPEAKGSSQPPSFVTKARFGLEIRQASLLYKDEAQSLESKITDLNFLIKDFSMDLIISILIEHLIF